MNTTNTKNSKTIVKTRNGYRDYVREPFGFRVEAHKDGKRIKYEYASNTSIVNEIESRYVSEGYEPVTYWTNVDTVD